MNQSWAHEGGTGIGDVDSAFGAPTRGMALLMAVATALLGLAGPTAWCPLDPLDPLGPPNDVGEPRPVLTDPAAGNDAPPSTVQSTLRLVWIPLRRRTSNGNDSSRRGDTSAREMGERRLSMASTAAALAEVELGIVVGLGIGLGIGIGIGVGVGIEIRFG